jgi:hypothetical protein
MPKITSSEPVILYGGYGVFTNGPKTGPGTSLELAIGAEVALKVAGHFGVSPREFTVAGPGPYALPKGAVTVTWYGLDEHISWPQWWLASMPAKAQAEEEGYRFVALNSNTLAVYFR